MAPRKQQRKSTPASSTSGPDLYAELGLARDATTEDVKRAYRRLALQCHPDKCPGDEAAHEKFQRISTAYSVLSDEQKRRFYDQTGTTEGLDISPDEFMDMFQSLLLEIVGGADMIRDMLSCFTPRELARLPPFPFPKELFPPGTFPPGLRFSSKGLKGLPPQVEDLIQNGDLLGMFAAVSDLSPTGPGGARRGGISGHRRRGSGGGGGGRQSHAVPRDPFGYGRRGGPHAAMQLFGDLFLGSEYSLENLYDDSDDDEFGESGNSSESEWTDVSESELEAVLSQQNAPQEQNDNEGGHAAAAGPSSGPRRSLSPPPQPGHHNAQEATTQPPHQEDAGKPPAVTATEPSAATVPSCGPLPGAAVSDVAAASPAANVDAPSSWPEQNQHQKQINSPPQPLLIRDWIMAARSGDVAALERLLEQEPRLLGCRGTGMGHTALHWCAAKGSVDGVGWLLRQGIDINIRNDDGATALHAAARNGRLEAVVALLAWRPAVGVFAGLLGTTAAAPAEAAVAAPTAAPGAVAATRLANACDLEAVDSEGRTALQLAVEFQHAQVAAVLMQAAAERDAEGRGTQPPEPEEVEGPASRPEAPPCLATATKDQPLEFAAAAEAPPRVSGFEPDAGSVTDAVAATSAGQFGGRGSEGGRGDVGDISSVCRDAAAAALAATAAGQEAGVQGATGRQSGDDSDDGGSSGDDGCAAQQRGAVDAATGFGVGSCSSGDDSGWTSGQIGSSAGWAERSALPPQESPPQEQHLQQPSPRTPSTASGTGAEAAAEAAAAAAVDATGEASVSGSASSVCGGVASTPPTQQPQSARRSVPTAEEKAARRAALLAADAAAEREEARREAEKAAQAEAAAAAAGLRSRAEGKAWLEAARRGDVATLQRMLAANPRLLRYQGQGTNFAFTLHTALHWSVAKGHEEVARWLLQQGADPDVPNAAGATPLHAAASQRADHCARLLVVEAAAKMGVPDALGETVRDILMRRDADGASGSSGSGDGGAKLASELELLARIAALRDAPGGSAEWTPRAMRVLLAAAGISSAGLLEKRELVDACKQLIARYPPRIAVNPFKVTTAAAVNAVKATSPTTVAAAGGEASRAAASTAATPNSSEEAEAAAESRRTAEPAAIGSTPAPQTADDGGGAGEGTGGVAAAAAAAAAASDAAKQRGNDAFTRGDFTKAVSHYTMAIRLRLEPNAVLYSNRAAAYCGMSYFGKAQADAEEAIRLDPQQPKYRCRLGVALLGQLQFREAEAAFRAALQLDPSYAAAVQGQADVRAAAARSGR